MAYRIGIDAGSKTLKLVVLDEGGSAVYSTYMRHRANIARTLNEAVHDLNWRVGALDATIAITGSAAIEVARMLGIPFVQEVSATTHAVRTLVPQADVAVELGGEDAKIIYLTGGLEQRMNAICAGGTGGFIDTIAYMLDVRPSAMSRLAFGASKTYPIASRCAVFAQTDVRPLLNAGASKSDIAASVFDAMVRQTLGGLACGRPIRGNVAFLGGPLEHMPYLVYAFRRALGLDARSGIKPKDAHLLTVTGAALLSDDERRLGCAPVFLNTGELLERIEGMGAIENDLERLEPLFSNEEELAAFRERHAGVAFERAPLHDARGPLFLGIDAGSTTLKLAVLDEGGELVHSAYEPIRGELIETLREQLASLYRKITPPSYLPHSEPKAWIARSCATGYGEELLRAALGVDAGVVETAAHLRAARELVRDLTFLLDIGGQDMKALWVRHGMVVDAALNEACSSGCGAFIEGTAAALKSTPWQFAADALVAMSPIDLGTKCTVFMSSRVKHAQKAGAPVEDIAAGVAYSVVKNALHRIIGEDRMPGPDDRVVVQGGTFKSDAVLRAFERVAGVEVVRPEQTHLMGAIGCALIARDEAQAGTGETSGLIGGDELERLTPRRSKLTCTGCANACTLSLVSFDDEDLRYFISDNKCERGLDELERRKAVADADVGTTPLASQATHELASGVPAPNLIALEQQLLGSFCDRTQEGSRGAVRVGLLDSMELHAYRPFWHTLLLELGLSVVMPEPACEADRMSEAWETIPSESVCYPAKTAHLRYFSLCGKGCDAVLMPQFERANHCPVEAEYARALAGNVGTARGVRTLAPVVSPLLASCKPERFTGDEATRARLLDALNAIIDRKALAGDGDGPSHIEEGELEEALGAALATQRALASELEQASERAFDWLAADPSRHGIVLVGRPYHADEALLHGIDRLLARMGFAVLGAAGLSARSKTYRDCHDGGAYPWLPAKRLVRLAGLVADHPQLDAVFLQSFGCGFEAVSLEEAREVLDAAAKPCTVLKIDDMSDVAHIRIRLRTLAAAIEARERGDGRHHLCEFTHKGSSCAQPARPLSKIRSKGIEGSSSALVSASFLDDIATHPLGPADLECARRCGVKDACFTANALAARVIRMVEGNPCIEVVELPRVCETCITEAVPRIVERATGKALRYSWVSWRQEKASGSSRSLLGTPPSLAQSAERPRIGIVGNALLCFEPFMNDGIVAMLEDLGREPVLPDPELLAVEDVRYLDQLAVFERQGIRDVIYLQSFGCLKGHVSSRGALRELRELHPSMRITVIDYDPESSALNRENRIRLAVDAAREG